MQILDIWVSSFTTMVQYSSRSILPSLWNKILKLLRLRQELHPNLERTSHFLPVENHGRYFNASCFVLSSKLPQSVLEVLAQHVIISCKEKGEIHQDTTSSSWVMHQEYHLKLTIKSTSEQLAKQQNQGHLQKHLPLLYLLLMTTQVD